MNAVDEVPQAEGDWMLRGMDVDTRLLLPLTDTLIDADRLVRLEWRNGFPNFALYRLVLAQDRAGMAALREFAVGLGWAVVRALRVRVAAREELAGLAGLDALFSLMHGEDIQPTRVSSDALGVHHETYERVRGLIFRFLRASLNEYWLRLGCAYRQVLLQYRHTEWRAPNCQKPRTIVLDGSLDFRSYPRGMRASGVISADGNSYLLPAPNPDNI